MPFRTTLGLCWVAWLCLLIWGGCQSSKAPTSQAEAEKALEERAKAEEERKKKPFEISAPAPLLSERIVEAEGGKSLGCVKPGHWTSVVQSMVAKYDDLEATSTLAVVDADRRETPLPLDHTAFALVSRRPALLAKGRPKRIEGEVFIPEDRSNPVVSSRLVRRDSGAAVVEPLSSRFPTMPCYQYFFLVLASEPSRYGYLTLADTVRAPWEDDEGSHYLHYRVVLADGSKPLPLPPHVLTWTSVAYVLWDDVDLAQIDPDQQRALVDWIHWGGRLIVSGPDSLDALRSSFLADYLPVESRGSQAIGEGELADLNAGWGSTIQGKPFAPLQAVKNWAGLELAPRDPDRDLRLRGTGGLFYQRSVGLGSVLVSAIRLSERELINWPGYDSFLNNALLGRRPRRFSVRSEGMWTGVQSDWAGYANRTRDAYFTTPLRWLSRDAGTLAGVRIPSAVANAAPTSAQGWQSGSPDETPRAVPDRPGGLGAWNEFGPLSSSAREALVDAAGVRVPAASFVLVCLAAYLIVLVPLNWMVFHALRRVEWAWVAAPLIAIAGTAGVVHLAQLDIGFASARTEIALLELQGDYLRGHLTRYQALYTSLATSYDLRFDDGSAVAAPFPRDGQFALGPGDSASTVAFEKYDEPRLRDLGVASASTTMVHSEEMLTMEGALRLTRSSGGALQIDNATGFALRDAVVLRRSGDADKPRYEGCWIGELRSGDIKSLPLAPFAWQANKMPFIKERERAAEFQDRPPLQVDRMLRMAFAFGDREDPLHGSRGETRLVARVEAPLPGVRAVPPASQTSGVTIVVAHLQFGPLRDPQPDVNSPLDVATARRPVEGTEDLELSAADED